jgi:hypothetical protein
MTTFPTTGPLDVRLRFHGGTVEIDPSYGEQATALVEALDPQDERSAEAARAARIDCHGSRLTIDVPGKGKWRGGVNVRIVLTLPELSKVTSESGDVAHTPPPPPSGRGGPAPAAVRCTPPTYEARST